MTEPKKHHFLPKAAYLSNFQCEDRESYVYLYRRGQEILQVRLEDAGAQNHLYSLVDDGEPNAVIEKKICGSIDDFSTSILRKINSAIIYSVIQSQELIITASEKEILSFFIAFQHLRTPSMLQMLKDSYSGMIDAIERKQASCKELYHKMYKRILEKHPEFKYDEKQVEEVRQALLNNQFNISANGDFFLGQMMELTMHVYPYVLIKDMTILRIADESYFLTSDHPVQLIPDSNAPPLYRGGFFGSSIFIPVGSKTALFLTNNLELIRPKRLIGYECFPIIFVKGNDVERFNQRTIGLAENNLFCSIRSEGVRDLFNKTKKPKRFSIG